MAIGEPALVEIIREQIRRDGPVSFRWFMEQALYHPVLGYYSSGRAAIGRRGDYFTNVSVGPIFGELLARQFAEIWERIERPENFTIVEQGAHDGVFARDVLRFLQRERAEFFAQLHYRIVEPFPVLEARQRAQLAEFRDKISWRDSWEKLEPFTGLHFSNELLDALPVHLVAKKNSGWLERCVALTENEEDFVFLEVPISPELKNLAEANLEADGETEINPGMLTWVETLAPKIERGLALICDYGQLLADRGHPTLAVLKEHRAVASPLLEVGHADITAHVDWSSLLQRAEESGMQFAGFADQHHFLTGLVSEFFSDQISSSHHSLGRGLQTILHPGLLGRTFQFLALAKNVGSSEKLSGFKFGQTRAALQ